MEDQRLETTKVFKKIGYSLFTMMLVYLVAQTIILMIAQKLIPGIEESPWNIGLLIGIPFYCIAFPIFLLKMRKVPDGPKGEIKKMRYKDIILTFLISMAATYIFNIVGSMINMLIGLIKKTDIINPLENLVGGTSIIPIIIFIGILSPIIEEIVFRGVLLNKLRRYGDKTAIYFTALTFALFHGNLSQFFYAFVLGLIFGYIAINTNTIKYTIILHIAINMFGSAIMPSLALSGNNILQTLSVVIMGLFMIIGTILFITKFKNVKLESEEDNNYIKVKKKIIYANTGIILYYLLCLMLFIIVLMM